MVLKIIHVMLLKVLFYTHSILIFYSRLQWSSIAWLIIQTNSTDLHNSMHEALRLQPPAKDAQGLIY